jgi:hypothetical protein
LEQAPFSTSNRFLNGLPFVASGTARTIQMLGWVDADLQEARLLFQAEDLLTGIRPAKWILSVTTYDHAMERKARERSSR